MAMNYINYKTITAACGVGFLAYCSYFDYQRRHAPDYRERVTERREKARRAREQDNIELPPKDDEEAVGKFFVKEIELGEECLQAGDVDMAVKHFSYAVVFCPQPQNLLKYLREALPPPTYAELVKNLSVANKRIAETYNRIHIQEEDVE